MACDQRRSLWVSILAIAIVAVGVVCAEEQSSVPLPSYHYGEKRAYERLAFHPRIVGQAVGLAQEIR
jgi:hypothetical protein